jgi:hypothetical protein
MTLSAENVKLGVCSVIFDGTALGYTKGGVEAAVQTSSYEIKVDQFGDTPIGEVITGRMVTATVPLAETTLENLLLIMPGARLVTDGIKATGSLTFAVAAPVNNDAVTINGTTFTYRTSPVGLFDLAIEATFGAAASAFAAAVNANPVGYLATVVGGVVTLTARQTGTQGNVTITKVAAANVAIANPTGGVAATKAKVVVPTGTNINLFSFAKRLTLRPVGSNGEDDFTILRAATAGAIDFSYNHDKERIYSVEFKGYAIENGDLIEFGHPNAV